MRRIAATILVALSFVFASIGADKAEAASATMFLTPTTGSYVIGSTFEVKVKINSGGDAINAAEGVISFDTQRLELVSISKSGSVFTLWTREPANTNGAIAFGGGIPTPGFTGSSGTILKLTFKGKITGDAAVGFASGAILANDGLGTNVLSTLGGSKYSIIPGSYTPPAQQPPAQTADGTPAAPQIVSTTHPDPDSWYNKDTASFEWLVPSGITAVRLKINESPTTLPTVYYSPPINEKTIEDLSDGVYYFHARFRNAKGWGTTAHFAVRIDTVPPERFDVTVDNGGDTTNPAPLLKFKAVDTTSGIASYEISVGSQSFTITPDDLVNNTYQMPPQIPGSYPITVKALDKAGNFTVASAHATIEAIESPIITDYPERLNQGQQLVIKGLSLPNATIIVSVREDENPIVTGETKADQEGTWRYMHTKSLERGTHIVWATAKDERGAQSEPGESVTVIVSSPLFFEFGKIGIDYLTTMITFLILIFAGILAGFYAWYRITQWRRRLRAEVKEVEESVSKAFQVLYDDTQEQFDLLDKAGSKRGISKEEKKILERLKKNIKIAEKFVKKEIRDVEKEME